MNCGRELGASGFNTYNKSLEWENGECGSVYEVGNTLWENGESGSVYEVGNTLWEKGL